MEDVLMEIVKDRVDEKINTAVSTAVDAERQETLVLSIKNLMANLKFTIDQAMDALSIPAAQRDAYAGLVKKKM